MELLRDFHMPSFTRLIWVSSRAKELWSPRLKRASKAFLVLERLSVVQGLRKVFATYFHPEDFPDEAKEFARFGLMILPLRLARSCNGFSHCHLPLDSTKPWTYWCVVARCLGDAQLFSDAIAQGDHLTAGELLGYPECCRKHFHKVWTQGYIDPVWQAADNAVEEAAELIDRKERFLHIRAYPEVNPVLRYIGVRLVPHIPHSFTCEASKEMAKQWMVLGDAEGLGEDLSLAIQILSWPMEWSVLHGIIEVRTPVFKVSVAGAPTPVKWTIRLEGSTYPAEGAQGLFFPYTTRRLHCSTDRRSRV